MPIREYIFPGGTFRVKGKVMGFSGLTEVSTTEEYMEFYDAYIEGRFLVPSYGSESKIYLNSVPDMYSRLGKPPGSSYTVFSLSAYRSFDDVAILVQEFDPAYNSFRAANWIILPAYGIEEMYPIFSKNGKTYWVLWWYGGGELWEDYLDIYSNAELVTRINCSEFEDWMYVVSIGTNSTGSYLYIILGGWDESLLKVVDLSTGNVVTYSIPISISFTYDFYLHIVSGEPLGTGHIIYTTLGGVSKVYILPAGTAYEITEFVGYTPYYTTYPLGLSPEEFKFLVFDTYYGRIAEVSMAIDGSGYSIQYVDPSPYYIVNYISRVGNEFVDCTIHIKYNHDSRTITRLHPIIAYYDDFLTFATSSTNLVYYYSDAGYVLSNYVGSIWYPLYLHKEYAESQGYYYYDSKIFVVNYTDVLATYPRDYWA